MDSISPDTSSRALAEALEAFELAELVVAAVAEVALTMWEAGEDADPREIVLVALADMDADTGELQQVRQALGYIYRALNSRDDILTRQVRIVALPGAGRPQ